MCLILFRWQSHPRYALVLAANRDEFHARPTAAAAFWDDAPNLLAGRDLEAGGTWMGLTRSGRFAAITNYREPPEPGRAPPLSRGHLVRDYLESREAPSEYAQCANRRGDRYRGFTLLLGRPGELVSVSNRTDAPSTVPAGTHALSNHQLDTAWPKAEFGRTQLDALLEADTVDPDALLQLLADDSLIAGEEPAGFDLGLAPELVTRMLFIRSTEYGTRSSTVVLLDHDGRVEFVERQYNAEGVSVGTERFGFALEDA